MSVLQIINGSCKATSVNSKKLNKTVCIVHLSDTHNFTGFKVPFGDILIHSGDFSNYGSPEEVQKFVSFFLQQPHHYKILVCGNHEIELAKMTLSEIESLFHGEVFVLHDSSLELMGITFYGSPWNNTKQGWGVPASSLVDKWNSIPEGVDILITHMPAYGVNDLALCPCADDADKYCKHCDKLHLGYSHWGCKDLRRIVEERGIRAHLFGHVHDSPGITTTDAGVVFSNAAMHRTRVASVIYVQVPEKDGIPYVDWSPQIDLSRGHWPLLKLNNHIKENIEVSTPRAVLLMSGSLNPIHLGHLNCMHAAKCALTSKGYHVIGGFVSPSHDAVVWSKSCAEQEKGETYPYVNGYRRMKMAEIACEKSSWINVSGWEVQKAVCSDIRQHASALFEYLRANHVLIQPEDDLFIVCGHAGYVKYGLHEGLYEDENSKKFKVIYVGDETAVLQHELVTPVNDTTPYVSSSEVRRGIVSGESLGELLGLELLHYLSDQGKDAYK